MKRVREGEQRYYEYSINDDVVLYHSQLFNFKAYDNREFHVNADKYLKFKRCKIFE
jgi:hypothetical protein